MTLNPLKDRYGFLFWLRWILSFAGSFVFSALFWTMALKNFFGPIEGEELVLTWTVTVFGTWFILVIPFMRKKEQIWKRLNEDQERSVDAWFSGLSFFIGTFILSALFWSVVRRDRFLPNEPGLEPAWAKPVFLTWFLLWIPLLIWMYRSADRIFKTAHARQTHEPDFKRLWIEPGKRELPEALSRKLNQAPPTLLGGHLVKARLRSGEEVQLFVLNTKEVAGAYDYHRTDFDASEVVDLEPANPTQIPSHEESGWVRFNIAP